MLIYRTETDVLSSFWLDLGWRACWLTYSALIKNLCFGNWKVIVGSGDFEIQLCFQQRHKYKVFHCSVIFWNVNNCWALETDYLCTREKQTKAGESRLWLDVPLRLIVQKGKKEWSCFSNGCASNAPFIFPPQDLHFHLHLLLVL